ncbi:MAG: Lrp/AsnC family transcriptional regulator [Pseudomonadales bacterium]
MYKGLATPKGSTGQLDDIDHGIVSLLRKDGRMAYRAIATELGLTEATVRARIKRMEESNSMRVVAVTDIEAAGFGIMLAVGVEVEGRSSADVARDFAEFEEAFSVSVVVGSHDVEILAVAKDQDQLGDLLQRFSEIRGVRRLLPSIAVDVLKNQSNWVPF